MSQFDGAIALVTGGASGLGQGAAEVLAARGATVWIADRNAQGAEMASNELVRRGFKVFPVTMDVEDAEFVEAAFTLVEKRSGAVKLLVNAAGINARKAALDVDPGIWERVIGINLTGTFRCAQRMARQLKIEEVGGAIVNITSMLAHFGAANLAPYGSSKGGVAMLTRCLATEWASLGIRVNAVSPGYIDTAMTRRMLSLEAYGGSIRKRTPLGRFGTAQDIGLAIAFLLSEDATFITGQILAVDGGMTGGDPNVSPPTDQEIAALLELS